MGEKKKRERACEGMKDLESDGTHLYSGNGDGWRMNERRK